MLPWKRWCSWNSMKNSPVVSQLKFPDRCVHKHTVHGILLACFSWYKKHKQKHKKPSVFPRNLIPKESECSMYIKITGVVPRHKSKKPCVCTILLIYLDGLNGAAASCCVSVFKRSSGCNSSELKQADLHFLKEEQEEKGHKIHRYLTLLKEDAKENLPWNPISLIMVCERQYHAQFRSTI